MPKNHLLASRSYFAWITVQIHKVITCHQPSGQSWMPRLHPGIEHGYGDTRPTGDGMGCR
jgi:hypothetical protein